MLSSTLFSSAETGPGPGIKSRKVGGGGGTELLAWPLENNGGTATWKCVPLMDDHELFDWIEGAKSLDCEGAKFGVKFVGPA